MRNFPARFDYGYNNPNPKLEDKTDLLKKIAHHVLISMQFEEIQQFLAGLNGFGLLDVLKKYSLEAMELFTYNETLMNSEAMKSCFTVVYSEDSNKVTLEEDIVYNWKNFIDEIGNGKSTVVKTFSMEDIEDGKTQKAKEKKISLGDFMMFLTGSKVSKMHEKIKIRRFYLPLPLGSVV